MRALRTARFNIEKNPSVKLSATVQATISSKPYRNKLNVDFTQASSLVRQFYEENDSLRRRNHHQTRLHLVKDVIRDGLLDKHRQLGTDLLSILLQDPHIKGAFEAILHESSGESSSVFVIEIHSDDKSHHLYPWEACAYANWDELNIDKPDCKIVVARFPREPNINWSISEPVRVFACPTAPKVDHPPNFDTEYGSIKASLKKVEKRYNDVSKPDEIHVESVREHIKQNKPHIIHLTTHGDAANVLFNTDSGKKNEVDQVNGKDLKSILSGAKDDLRLLVLSSCSTLGLGTNDADPWIGAVLSEVVPYLIGMQYQITDQIAEAFCTGFYSSLAASKTIVESFAEGRDYIIKSCPGLFEWIAPVLVCNARDYKDFLVFTPLDVIYVIKEAIVQLELIRKNIIDSPKNLLTWRALKIVINDVDARFITQCYESDIIISMHNKNEQLKISFETVEKEVRRIRGGIFNIEDMLSVKGREFRVRQDFGNLSSKLLDRLRNLSVELKKMQKEYPS